MDQTPVTRVSYAGPTTCLRCDQKLGFLCPTPQKGIFQKYASRMPL